MSVGGGVRRRRKEELGWWWKEGGGGKRVFFFLFFSDSKMVCGDFMVKEWWKGGGWWRVGGGKEVVVGEAREIRDGGGRVSGGLERRCNDEMSRGYFADMADLKKHGGKIAVANQAIISAATAVKFPTLEASYTDGKTIKLPFASDAIEGDQHKATLVCLSFRANSQAMVDSWSKPFHEAFSDSSNIHIYEVSFVDSWFLSLKPVKLLLLRMMKKSNPLNPSGALQRQCVYSFGDNYYFRKELKILNLLTGYIFLLDNFGRVRWQGFGVATEEELSSLLSCTSLLLDEK
ncbi:hypothetical protein KSS87_008239 [Heliosperma pusillum]|nr:hypothetical protein KSS87_008239 [Heliosperma pusillum]